MTRIAYLAPEIPSVSCTFVYREILALEEATGLEVVAFSMHPVENGAIAADGRDLAQRTTTLYDRFPRRLSAALAFALRRPKQASRTLWTAWGDARKQDGTTTWKLLFQCVMGLALAAELVRRDVQHLHVHFAHSPANVGMYAALAAGLPFSITAHANDLYVHAQLLETKIQRARCFATISEANRRHLVGAIGPRAAAVRLVRCGIDTEAFRVTSGVRSGRALLSVGRLVPKKGFDVLLRALARLADVSCRIVGDGPQRAELEALARELGVEDRVEFCGALPTEAIRAELAGADAFVLPCRRAPGGDVDGIPVVLMEAMASGVPVVTTRISGIPELVHADVNGLLVEPEDDRELALALARLTAEPGLRARLASEARDTVEAEFDLSTNVRTLAQLCRIEAPRHKPSRIETPAPKQAQGAA